MVTRALVDVIKVDYSPPDRTLTSTNGIAQWYAGDIILSAYIIPIVLATTANTEVCGIAGTTNKFVASYDTSTGTAGTPIDGQQANMPVTALADGNINVVYTVVAGGGTVTPVTRYVLTILRAPKF